MNYNMLEETIKQADWRQEVDELSVYHAFENLQDGRHKRGVRYDVALIFTLIVLGKLAGMTSLQGIAEWARGPRRVVGNGVANIAQELSLRSNIQQCVTSGGCKAG